MGDIEVAICGVGTLGANLAEHLARGGWRRLRLVDCDRVEEKNLKNQPYLQQQIGQPKVRALSEMLFRAVGAKATPLHQELRSHNAGRLLGGAGLIVDCFDNAAARAAVSEASRELRVPCLHAGMSRTGYGEVVWDEAYRVPPDAAGDPCTDGLARALSLLVVVAIGRAVERWRESGERAQFTVTHDDLRIEPLHMRDGLSGFVG
jgi:hypothetical protein